MRKHIDRSEIQKLSQKQANHAVSVVLPLSRSKLTPKNSKRSLKQMIAKAEKMLTKRATAGEISNLLSPLRDIADSNVFEKVQAEGVAFFLTENGMSHYFLSHKPDKIVTVNDRFYLRPLMSQINTNSSYMILALSENNTRLLKANSSGYQDITPDSMPQSIEVVRIGNSLKLAETEQTLAEIGSQDKLADAELSLFIRYIEKAIQPVLRSEALPLVLVGLPKLQGMFRAINTYYEVAPDNLSMSPDLFSDSELRYYTWERIKPSVPESRRVKSRYIKRLFNVREIVQAAHEGKVDSLYVAPRAHAWGVPTSAVPGEFEERSVPRDGDYDLLNEAAIQTFRHKGRVFELEPSKIGGVSTVALLRY